ncbi:hypothetical protein GGI64_002155 [Rhizobium leguminosarum]|uniref:Uncharacterized protein n=1 Tax=Rhizobium leguminosarum TaxID=384 RepID=A0A7Z0IY06_RHILE|nr:hypothetical protein [Rhizobium leguminosarum]NYJ11104.1 hypothetical protein [Rhizobium leguminosarum]
MPVAERVVPRPPPSALPGISPTGGEIASGQTIASVYRFTGL